MKMNHATHPGHKRPLRPVSAPVLALLFLPLLLTAGATAAAQAEDWQLLGRQGLVQMVIVPAQHVRDEDAYREQIRRLCPPETTCFVNFYSNSTGATPALPLPEAISAEATATFRRSMKQMVERFSWACRMQMPQKDCF